MHPWKGAPPLGHRRRGVSERDAAGKTRQEAQRSVGGRGKTGGGGESKDWVSDVRQKRVKPVSRGRDTRDRTAWKAPIVKGWVKGLSPDEVRVGKKVERYSVGDGSNGARGVGLGWRTCVCAQRGAAPMSLVPEKPSSGRPLCNGCGRTWASPISPTGESSGNRPYSCGMQEGVRWRKMTRKRRMASHTGDWEWEQRGRIPGSIRFSSPVVDAAPRWLSRPWRRRSYGRLPLDTPFSLLETRQPDAHSPLAGGSRLAEGERYQEPRSAGSACLPASTGLDESKARTAADWRWAESGRLLHVFEAEKCGGEGTGGRGYGDWYENRTKLRRFAEAG